MLSANSNGELLSTCFVSTDTQRLYLTRQALNPETCGPLGARSRPPKGYGDKDSPGMFGFIRNRGASIALGADNAISAFSNRAAHKTPEDISVFLYSKTGDVLGHQELGTSFTTNDKFKPIRSRTAVVFDGKTYLAFCDGLFDIRKRKRDVMSFAVRTVGWRLSADGKVEDANGFLVGGEDGFDAQLPAAAAGPEGVSLVVYTVTRGVDDTKVMMRVVR